MTSWVSAVFLLTVLELIALASLDGTAPYTLSIGGAIVLIAVVFASSPRHARMPLFIATVFFAIYVAARLDAIPAKLVIGGVIIASTAWSLLRARTAVKQD